MPLLQLPISAIELPVSDRVLEGTIVKQRVTFDRMNILAEAGVVHVVQLFLTVRLFAVTAENGYGPELTGKGFSAYPVVLIADNNTAVDPATGDLLYIRLTEATVLNFLAGTVEEMPAVQPGEDRWHSYLDEKPEPLELQGRHFWYLSENVDVRIHDLIKKNIRQADAMGTHFQ